MGLRAWWFTPWGITKARSYLTLSNVTETGWPYLQHRGGAPGFLRVLSPTQLGFADYTGNRQMLSTGNLAVTAAPTRTYPGHRVVVRATGQVGDSGGRLYLYRNLGTGCRASVDAERPLGPRKVPIGRPRAIPSTFDFSTSYRAGRGGTREWVCGYLYVINCDAAGNNCGAATGLPPGVPAPTCVGR